MAQKTLVVKVPAPEQGPLQERLAQGAFEFRTVPHALFSVKGEGAVATLYKSGKFVIQSAEPEAFLAAYTSIALEAAPQASAAELQLARVDEPVIGSDETGKGDYFGPLVVCAVYLEPADVPEIKEAGIVDSKRLTDKRAGLLGAWLRSRVPFSIQRLDPPEYNRVYPTYRGLNPLLADLHGRAVRDLIETLAGRHGADDGRLRVVVDQFAHESVMLRALRGAPVRLEQAPRAEANPAVAAASVIARQEFLACMQDLSTEYGAELRKGAGAQVDEAGRELVRTHGADVLPRLAKMHFKNTQKILPEIP
ncbi:MAG: ribonuclease HIII [Planctomycetota bacterium]